MGNHADILFSKTDMGLTSIETRIHGQRGYYDYLPVECFPDGEGLINAADEISGYLRHWDIDLHYHLSSKDITGDPDQMHRFHILLTGRLRRFELN